MSRAEFDFIMLWRDRKNCLHTAMELMIIIIERVHEISNNDVLYLDIHFTFLYLNCFLHAVIYFVHCALSIILLIYICACCDTRCF